MRAKSISMTDHVTCALNLLEALSTAGTAGVDADKFMSEQGLSADELSQAREMILTLADRESGARVHIDEREGRLFLGGTDGQMLPLRLSLSEGLVLSHLIDAADIDSDTKHKIETALLPLNAGSELRSSVSSTSTLGPWVAVLNEAIEYGIRTELLYRSSGEAQARMRIVDPHEIESHDGFTYLVAWDVDKNEKRLYRFDRIVDVQKTDESVARRDQDQTEDLHSELAHDSRLVKVSLPTSVAKHTTWAGIVKRSACKTDPQRTILSVHVKSSTWLFEQVLAGGGTIRIENDPELASEFQNWAQKLKI